MKMKRLFGWLLTLTMAAVLWAIRARKFNNPTIG